jgi:hypothetical protein
MKTIRIFSAPHKALRKTMSDFMILCGQTNFRKPEAIDKLKKAGAEMFFLLTAHANTEDTIVLKALENKVPGAAEHDTLDHVKIEELQHNLENHLNRLNASASESEAHDFYLKFALFFSLYLEHIDEEETVTQQLIWENLPDEEQLSIHASIVKKMDPAVYAIWLKHMIPAQNENENIAMLEAMNRNMPANKFEALMETLAQSISSEKLNPLLHRVTEKAE